MKPILVAEAITLETKMRWRKMNTKPMTPEQDELEQKIYALSGDPDKYSEFLKDNYGKLTYDNVALILRETMSWPSNAKFRLRYSMIVFKRFCGLMVSRDDYVDYIAEDIILQWVWKNRNYYADSIIENERSYAAIMYNRLHDRFQYDPSWDEPFRQIDEKIAPTRCLNLLHDSNE